MKVVSNYTRVLTRVFCTILPYEHESRAELHNSSYTRVLYDTALGT